MRYYILSLVYVLCVGSYLLSGCTSETEPAPDERAHFVELDGGTCGDIEPTSDLSSVCDTLNLGGLAYKSLSDDGVWTLECVDGGAMEYDSNTGTGRFSYSNDVCASSYGIVQHRKAEVASKKEELRGPFRYTTNNFSGSIECASRMNALKALVRGWLPNCQFTCTSEGANRICTSINPACSPPVYLTNCSIGPTEHCTVGISFFTAGALDWTGGSRSCGAGWSGTASISGGSQLFGLQASVTEKWLNP